MNNFRLLPRDEYPSRLLEIPQVPKKLYLEGNLPPSDAICLCVVGARSYSEYGKRTCEKLIACLHGKNVAIISGLALGIDSIAHRAALNAGLFTLALPGSGLNREVLHPQSNVKLAEKILESGGGLMSEFEPDFKATYWSFPQRNRIMAGISKATLIIEASLKSGTLITAKLATEYNRDVLTVPGSIYSETSKGPHMLMRLGATPITCEDDLLEALGFERENEKGNKNSPNQYDDCSPEEKKILTLLENPLSRDELIQALALPTQSVNIMLSLLEIKGHIKECLGLLHKS